MTKAQNALSVLKDKSLDEIFWEEWLPEYVRTHEEDLEERRWYMVVQTVFEFDDGSYVAVRWGRGSTENQEDEGPFAVYLVEPYQFVEIRFKRVSP